MRVAQLPHGEDGMNEVAQTPALPDLKAAGDIGSVRPTMIIDTREQDPLPIARLKVVRAGLQSGDYSFVGGEEVFSVERKSIADLIACCTGGRERFERELHRLRGFHFKRLLIVGERADVENGRYRSDAHPRAVLHTLAAFEVRYDLPVVWTPTPASGARLVENWAWWFAREMVEAVNRMVKRTEQETVNA